MKAYYRTFALVAALALALALCGGARAQAAPTPEEAHAIAQGWMAALSDGECASDWWHSDHLDAALAASLRAQCGAMGLDDIR